MAGQLLRMSPLRAFLKFTGVNRDANLLFKTPELCLNDFLESIDTTGTLKVKLKGYGSKAFSSGVALDLLSVPLPAGGSVSFLVRANVFATDGTDMQSFTEMIQVSAVNKAGTVTATATNLATTGAKAVSAGTITTSYALTTVGTGTEKLQVTVTTSLTPTSTRVRYTVENIFPPSATEAAFL